jgi:hypothetical protein
MTKKFEFFSTAPKKTLLFKAQNLLNAAMYLSEPLENVPEPEINYYGFTLINVLYAAHVFALSALAFNIILPVIWNYLDGFCSIITGLDQFLNKDDYGQKRLKTKGSLNIFSGIQLFVLSYNPLLIAALAVTGSPVLLVGIAFSISTLIDLITTSIDVYYAEKENDINKWFDERINEYNFILNNINLVPEGTEKSKELETKLSSLEKKMISRYHANINNISENHTKLFMLAPETKPSDFEITERLIKNDIEESFNKAKNILIIKLWSFIGMALLTIGSFALFLLCPPAIMVAGLIITAGVSGVYALAHGKEIKSKLFKKEDSEITPFQSDTSDCTLTIVL